MSSSIYSAQEFIPSVDVDTKAALFARFLKLFPLRLNSLVRKIETPAWTFMSKFHYLSDDEICASIVNHPTHLRACSFDEKTTFAVIGIPATSRYNHIEQFLRLTTVLTQCGLKPKTYKSAGTGDLHIYLSFVEEMPSSALSRALSRLLMHKGFELSPHTLVVYPSNLPLVLPLQAGFSWLNDHLQVKVGRDEISMESALGLFLSDISRSAVPYEVLLQGSHPFDLPEVILESEQSIQSEQTRLTQLAPGPLSTPQPLQRPQALELVELLETSQSLELPEILEPSQSVELPEIVEPWQSLELPEILEPWQSVELPELLESWQPLEPAQPLELLDLVELLEPLRSGELEHSVHPAARGMGSDPGGQLLLFPPVVIDPLAPSTKAERKQGRRPRPGLPGSNI